MPPPPPPGPPPPGPPPPPAAGLPPAGSQPGRKALLSSIERKPQLKKVDRSQINDRSAPSLGGSSGSNGVGPGHSGGSMPPRQSPAGRGAGMPAVRPPSTGLAKCPPPPTGLRTASAPPPVPKTGRSQSIDLGASIPQKKPVLPPVQGQPANGGGFRLPSLPPSASMPSMPSNGRRNSMFDSPSATKPFPPSQPIGTGKSPPPPPPPPSKTSQQQQQQSLFNGSRRPLSVPTAQPPHAAAWSPPPPVIPKTNGTVSSLTNGTSAPQFRLPTATLQRTPVVPSASDDFPPAPRFPAPVTSLRDTRSNAVAPAFPQPVHRTPTPPRPGPAPVAPPVISSGRSNSKPGISGGALPVPPSMRYPSGPPPAIPPPRGSTNHAAAMRPPPLPNGPPPPLPPPRMSSKSR